jgi:hypothetical protein
MALVKQAGSSARHGAWRIFCLGIGASNLATVQYVKGRKKKSQWRVRRRPTS